MYAFEAEGSVADCDSAAEKDARSQALEVAIASAKLRRNDVIDAVWWCVY